MLQMSTHDFGPYAVSSRDRFESNLSGKWSSVSSPVSLFFSAEPLTYRSGMTTGHRMIRRSRYCSPTFLLLSIAQRRGFYHYHNITCFVSCKRADRRLHCREIALLAAIRRPKSSPPPLPNQKVNYTQSTTWYNLLVIKDYDVNNK